MKIAIEFEKVNVKLTDDDDKVVYAFEASDYRFEADTIGFVKAIGEHAPAIREVAKKFEEL